jgi:hypothetical protein
MSEIFADLPNKAVIKPTKPITSIQGNLFLLRYDLTTEIS